MSGFCLPPRVHHRAAAAPDDLPVPDPRLGIDGLADRAKQAETRQVAATRIVVAPAHEGADGRGRGVADGDAVLFDDAPEAILVRCVRRAFIHDGGGAVGERAVDHIGVTGDPADIGRAPIDVGVLQIEDPLGRRIDAGEIAAGGVLDALGLARRARGVEEVEHVLRVHFFRRTVGIRPLDELVPPHVTAGLHVDGLAGALEHHHRLDVGAILERFVHVLLEGHDTATPPAAVPREEHGGLGVVDPLANGIGREAAEDHAVGSPDARAREHGDGRLRHHGHVDGHAIAALHSRPLERAREAVDLAVEIPVG